MIKNSIKRSQYKNHLNVGSASCIDRDIFVVDYSTLDDAKLKKKGTQFLDIKPNNIDAFKIKNEGHLNICCIRYTNKSFTKMVDGSRQFCSQCEGAAFPYNSKADSWILFTELKYCKEDNNGSNIKKACCQLLGAWRNYKKENIILTNTCYLIISLPTQTTPYSQTRLSQSLLLWLKNRRNIVMRAIDSVEVINSDIILVE